MSLRTGVEGFGRPSGDKGKRRRSFDLHIYWSTVVMNILKGLARVVLMFTYILLPIREFLPKLHYFQGHQKLSLTFIN